MIRFCSKRLIESNNMDITIISENISAEENLWDDAKKIFRRHVSYDEANVIMIPIINMNREVVCYAYQDSEANRELRMLKELEKNRDILQFKDVFPEIREVVVCGCNELAYRFVQYLEKQEISVIVAGKYWNYFGYEETTNIDVDGEYTLVVYAEELISRTGRLYQKVIRSASPEFECIDRIYEANVLEGKIKDARGNIEELLERLKGKEVIILGTDASAQDAYDFLYEHGIDICCFSEWQEEKKRNIRRTLLGKNVVGLEESINSKTDAVFICNSDKNSALGTENVDIFDYYGYERNETFFLLQDYTQVQCTNLLHVLKGKRVLFVGDERLCTMLSDYLNEKEQEDINVEYIELSQCLKIKETDILCAVSPWYVFDDIDDFDWCRNPKKWYFEKMLSEYGDISYTEYFSQTKILVQADLNRNRGKKYSIKELLPKGILLGRIQYESGNVFLRGLIDGHPDILQWKWTDALSYNLFLYCIRLAGEKAEDILITFRKIYQEELAFVLDNESVCWDKFEKSARTLLSSKKTFTSQELFVIFHVAYAEMLCGYKIMDMNKKIIYWEPHHFPREDFPFLAQWLEDDQIHGQTIFMHRDHIVWSGAAYNYCCKHIGEKLFNKKIISLVSYCTYNKSQKRTYLMESSIPGLAAEKMLEYDIDMTYKYWEEFQVRFEDIKLHPQRELRKLCGRLGLQWSDTLLQTTDNNQIWAYRGEICGFEIKPVFNKYEEFLSEFDRFRISLISSPYQRRYGYIYEDCMKFTRRELQEMFLKEFRFQKELRFICAKDRNAYFSRVTKLIMDQLWKVRKHALMDDIVPEFEEVEIGENITKKPKRAKIADKKELASILKFVREQERLVLYGTGKDCEGLLALLDEDEQSKLVFSDLKAEYMEKIFHDSKVVAPSELCGKYKDYKILITSSQFYENMQQRLEDFGISKDRITCNRFQLWE